MQKQASAWPRRALIVFGVSIVAALLLADATLPLRLGADRAMVFQRHLWLFAFLIAGTIATAMGTSIRVVCLFVVVAFAAIVTRVLLTTISLEPSSGIQVASEFSDSIRRRSMVEAAWNLGLTAVAGILCWAAYKQEKQAEPGATDNPDDAQR